MMQASDMVLAISLNVGDLVQVHVANSTGPELFLGFAKDVDSYDVKNAAFMTSEGTVLRSMGVMVHVLSSIDDCDG